MLVAWQWRRLQQPQVLLLLLMLLQLCRLIAIVGAMHAFFSALTKKSTR